MSRANVQADAIRDFRVALIKFIEIAGISLADGDGDVLRTLSWLEMEQVPYWSTQMRKREELVERCKDAVRQKTLYKDSAGRPQSAIEEQKQLKRAQAMLLEAQEKFAASKQYVRRIQKQQMEYKGQIQKLGLTLTGDLAACVAKLQNLQNIVSEYAKLDAPSEARSMAQAEPVNQPATPQAAEPTTSNEPPTGA